MNATAISAGAAPVMATGSMAEKSLSFKTADMAEKIAVREQNEISNFLRVNGGMAERIATKPPLTGLDFGVDK
ncbi:MAG: hypothetical protein M9920_02580 [Verrucomicrobiae bacterium]|nr:hypothetical protein [Verrucomicrobiae bacterium]